MTSAALRAVVYCRISVDRTESVSVAEQERACRAYAEAKGWQVAAVLKDEGFSGSDKGLRLDRPGLTKVRQSFDNVDVVIFASLDRLARSVVDFHTFAEEAASHGVALVSIRESLDMSTPSGRFVASILAAFAEMEAATISLRVAASIAARVREGRFRGGKPPYGFRSVPNPKGAGRVLEVVDAEAEVIKDAARRVLAGEPVNRIVADLNARGVPTAKGRQWAPMTLRRILVSEAIAGRITHHGKVVRDEQGMAVTAWEPIISAEDSARLRAALEPQPLAAARRNARLLSGMVFCASCGSVCTVSGTSKGTVFYRCSAKGQGRPCERCVAIGADALDEHVTQAFLDSYGASKRFQMVRASGDPEGLAEVVEAINACAQAMTEPGADMPALFGRMQLLASRRDELESAPRLSHWEVEDRGTVAERWESALVWERQQMLAEHIAKVVIAPGVRGRKGFQSERVELVPVSPNG